MRFVILVAALVTALIAAAIGFDIIDLNEPDPIESRYAVGWLAWSAALVVLASLVPDR